MLNMESALSQRTGFNDGSHVPTVMLITLVCREFENDVEFDAFCVSWLEFNLRDLYPSSPHLLVLLLYSSHTSAEFSVAVGQIERLCFFKVVALALDDQPLRYARAHKSVNISSYVDHACLFNAFKEDGLQRLDGHMTTVVPETQEYVGGERSLAPGSRVSISVDIGDNPVKIPLSALFSSDVCYGGEPFPEEILFSSRNKML